MNEGVRIGPYRLDRLLARGGFSEVHLAVHEASGQTCALKIWAPPAGVPAARAGPRFDAEVRARRRLDHPDIQRLLDAGQFEGRAWMALEWVPGTALTRYTRAAMLLPVALVAQIGARVAAALAHAHGLGVLHRDLKPDNVVVHLPERVVKVLDFGLALVHDEVRQTRSGEWVGSPAYMAPEQLTGAPADAAGDVYALGAVLFELLAGRQPFEAATLGELLRSIASDPLPELGRLRPDLPSGLISVVGRALDRDPGVRFARAEHLADALAPWTTWQHARRSEAQ